MSIAYVARVVDLAAQGPLVRVPMLGADQEWGPLASSVPDLAVDDQVIVVPLGQSTDRLHVLARLQARQPRQTEIVGLADRLDDIEARNVYQDGRMDTMTAATGSALDALAARATSLEGRTGAVETRNTAQDNRLTAIEGKNSDQDTSISANATAISTNGQRITTLDGATLHRTGAETKSGVLTLSDQPIIPAPTLVTSPVRHDDVRLGRRMCKVRLTSPTDGFALVGGAADVFARGGWSVPTGGDPFKMFTAGGGASGAANEFAFITLPISGAYLVRYRALALNSTNTADTIVAFITCNARASSASAARDPKRFIAAGNDGTPMDAWEVEMFDAGDKLYWGNWSSVNARVTTTLLNKWTEVTVIYLGPNLPIA